MRFTSQHKHLTCPSREVIMLTINSLAIQNIGRIEALKIELNDGVNLICGPNGIGKTTILECIGQAFSRAHQTVLRKRVGSTQGQFNIIATTESGPLSLENKVENFEPQNTGWTPGAGDWEKSVITLKTNRAFSYLAIDSLAKDPNSKDRHRQLGAQGIQFEDIKNWIVNRYMFSKHEDHLTPEQLKNLELAKRAFSALDSTVQFAKVIPSSFDIMVRTPDGEIYFEYLSSGFKSCLCLIIGLIKEIEYRFTDPFISADRFNGVIVIDELDLHLHPEWQPRLVSLLKIIFPSAQIIGSTHSPHMIQAAEQHEIIALETNAAGAVIKRDLPLGESGFQGWTIEEILTDVMGMPDTRSVKYRSLEDAFELAINSNNRPESERILSDIERFLHPQNVQSKLFRLQLGRLED